MVNSKPQTAAIVTACVRRRLMQAGFYWCPQVDASPDGREAIDAALRLCEFTVEGSARCQEGR